MGRAARPQRARLPQADWRYHPRVVAAPLIVVYAILLLPMAVAFGTLIVAAGSLLVDAWRCRHPSADLLERLDAHRFSMIGEEAQRWLDRQRPH